MYPMRLAPIYQHYIWGGERILQKYGRDLPEGRYAESWEVSDRKEGQSIVLNGAFQGKSLDFLVKQMGEALLGEGRKDTKFPLLVKLIDAKQTLSVQVHPDETAASLLKAEAKTEAWIILEKGFVFAGFEKPVTKDVFLQAVKENKIENLLHKIPVELYDAIYIAGGVIHAIGQGTFLLEVQQNSNTTYRVYDWGRNRELHLSQAMECLKWGPSDVRQKMHLVEKKEHLLIEELVQSPYFTIEKILSKKRQILSCDSTTFQILFCEQGEGKITVDGHQELFSCGMTYLIPAKAGDLALEGDLLLFRIFLPPV